MTNTPEKKVIQSGTRENEATTAYRIFDDGSMEAQCVHCREWEEKTPEQFEKFKNKPGWWNGYECARCWKNPREAARSAEQKKRERDIHWGQAYNLAVTLAVKGLENGAFKPDEFWEAIEQHHAEILDHMTRFRARSQQDTNDASQGTKVGKQNSTK